MKRILMVAFHFPPLAGSSGIQRTLRLVQHLPQLGWQPIVLSAAPHAYERTSDDLLKDVPADTIVRRAFALDTARHLSIKGRYIGALSRPDRWMTWRMDGVRQGMKLIEEYKPDAIWSTYPIATAHRIAATLQKRSGLPWFADFRDPMAQPNYPPDPRQRAAFLEIEAQVVKQAKCAIFTTPSAAEDFATRYPAIAKRVHTIENGYDEASFENLPIRPQAPISGPITLLHSGIIYPSERDPEPLFIALRRLIDDNKLKPSELRLRFRAAVHDDLLRNLSIKYKIEEMIEIAPVIPYRAALSEMLSIDGLLLMQAANCNAQIPAKAYEYLRAQRPIIALTDHKGDTARVLREAGIDAIATLESADAIYELLPKQLQLIREGKAKLATQESITNSNRITRSTVYSALFSSDL